MVRGPPPVLRTALGIPLLALAYFLAAPAFPALPAGDVTILVAGGIGLVLVGATTLSLLPARETVAGPLLIALGAGLLAGALNDGGIGAAANVFEALLAAAIGILFARAMSAPVMAIAVPVFVALLDIWSVATGPTAKLLEREADAADPLSFDMPAWGDMGSAGQVGVSDAIFLSMFAAWTWRHGFRRGATIAGLAAGLLAALLLGVTLDRAIPAIPLLAAGFLLPNADRLAWLLRPAAP